MNHSRGSVSIEAAILIPLFIGSVFLILQSSLWIHASSVAQVAAEDGVRAGTAMGAGDRVEIVTAEEILSTRVVGQAWTVTATTTSESMTVTVTGQATSVIPGWVWEVRESATLPWEVP